MSIVLVSIVLDAQQSEGWSAHLRGQSLQYHPDLGVKSANGLAEQLKGKVAEVCVIGDAKEPRLDAIAEGADVGLRI